MNLIHRLIRAAKEAWTTEPTRVLTVAASVIVFICAKFGLVVSQATILEALAFIVPILIAGGLTRAQVTPAQKALALARNRVISHHRLRRRAYAREGELLRLQARAGSGDPSAISALAAVGLDANHALRVPKHRIAGWWVVEVVT